MGNLTVKVIEAAKAGAKEYKLTDGDGLAVRIARDGRKTWLVRYMLNGKQYQYTLPRQWGKETTDGTLALADARDEARKVRAKAREGIDHPAELEARSKAAVAASEVQRVESLAIRDLFDEWMRDGITHKDGGRELRRRMEKDVIPAIGTRQVRTVIERDVLNIVRAIVKRGANRSALMVLNDCRQMFGWAEDRLPWRRLIEVNPAGSIDERSVVGRDYREGASTRFLAEREIPELHRKIRAMRDAYHDAPNKRIAPQPLDARTEHAIWLMLSTMCRVGEITRARRSDIDLDAGTWTIPAEHAKNTDAHTVYLSEFAAGHFRALLDLPHDSEWLFSSPSDSRTHIDLKSITKQIGDRQLSKTKRDPGKGRTKAEGADALMLSGGGWSPHTLRRTGSTMMEALGVLPTVIDKCLNHREPSKLRRTYMRHDYANEKREAWRLLGERIDLLTRDDASNVHILAA